MRALFITFVHFSLGGIPFLFITISVDGGQRAVIFDRFTGVKQHVTGEGTHFLIPWVQRPIIFDIRSRPRSVPSVTGSKGNWDHYIKVHLYWSESDKDQRNHHLRFCSNIRNLKSDMVKRTKHIHMLYLESCLVLMIILNSANNKEDSIVYRYFPKMKYRR